MPWAYEACEKVHYLLYLGNICQITVAMRAVDLNMKGFLLSL